MGRWDMNPLPVIEVCTSIYIVRVEAVYICSSKKVR